MATPADGDGLGTNSMNAKVFLDTNVLAYAIDADEPVKRHQARSLIAGVSGRMVISTQVVQEFFVTATRKMGVEALVAKDLVRGMIDAAELVSVSPSIIHRAIDLTILFPVSFRDGLILSAAEDGACSVVYTEDLNAGQTYGAVEVRNPFAGPV
jgi:predicted nucleic acid-binding protein